VRSTVGKAEEADVVDAATDEDEDETPTTIEEEEEVALGDVVRPMEEVLTKEVVFVDLQLVVSLLCGAAQANEPLKATAATNKEALILKLEVKRNDFELTAEPKHDHLDHLIINNLHHHPEMRSTSTIQNSAINKGIVHPCSQIVRIPSLTFTDQPLAGENGLGCQAEAPHSRSTSVERLQRRF
jgi:hypothetical protein